MQRRHFIGVLATLALPPSAVMSRDAGTLLLIGTQASGPGQGILSARLDEKHGTLGGLQLAAEIDRPTWLALDPKRAVVYSTSDVSGQPGAVASLSIDRASGRLAPISRVASGGVGPTSLDSRGGVLFVAHYGSGQVAAIPIAADGALSPATSVQADSGSGPHRRQASPHAHAAVIDPSGRFVLVPDLGADKVFVYRFDAATRTLSPAMPAFVQQPAGSGPRHLAFGGDGRFAYLVSELTAEVTQFGWDAKAGTLTELARTPLAAPLPGAAASAAEIGTGSGGKFLYVTNRGANSIEVFGIDKRSGALSPVQQVASGGKNPWSFGFAPSGRWLVVANQGSDSLNVFGVDRATGKLAPTPASLAVPKPVVLVFPR